MKKMMMFVLFFSILNLENSAFAQPILQSSNQIIVVNFVNISSVTNNPMIVTYATNNSSTDVFCSGACDILPQNGQLTFTAAKGNPSEGIIRFTYKINSSCTGSITYLIKSNIDEPIKVFDTNQVITPNTATTKIDCLHGSGQPQEK